MKVKNAIHPTRAQDFNEWYQQVIYAADLAEHSPVRGCMVIKPWGYALWERIQSLLDKRFKKLEVDNIYCPLLIPVSFLEKEAAHIEGFAKECAVVTHHRLAMDDQGRMVPASPLTEPYIIRPTSEAMMGHIFSQWIQSYRDVPLKINQWANVMRWEMRPRLFLRTSEFLWQEGHTAHAAQHEAEDTAHAMIKVYEDFFQNTLAIPVVQGEKSPAERFAGADITWTVEAVMQDGKALQAGTSHFLGQHFARAFDIKYTSEKNTQEYVWTTSWGVSTRMIGGLVMSHGDDDGLVLPPRIAPIQVVIVPVLREGVDSQAILGYAELLQAQMEQIMMWGEPIRVRSDTRHLAAGDKKWSWIKKGVPIRIEIGAQEVAANSVSVYTRIDATKRTLACETLYEQLPELLEHIQQHIYTQALQRQQSFILKQIGTWEARDKDHQGLYLVPWSGESEHEKRLADEALSVRCVLHRTHALVDYHEQLPCVMTGMLTECWALIGKSY